jgi:hypothetical protein
VSPFLEVFRALNAAEVRYLVIGGVAAALHGVPRMTGDIDLALDMSRDNLTKAINALLELGFVPRAPVDPKDFADPEIRSAWIRDKSLIAFGLYRAHPIPLEVDLLAEPSFDFDDAYGRRDIKQVEGVSVDVIDRQGLIRMKRDAGRTVDIEDADKLEKP